MKLVRLKNNNRLQNQVRSLVKGQVYTQIQNQIQLSVWSQTRDRICDKIFGCVLNPF